MGLTGRTTVNSHADIDYFTRKLYDNFCTTAKDPRESRMPLYQIECQSSIVAPTAQRVFVPKILTIILAREGMLSDPDRMRQCIDKTAKEVNWQLNKNNHCLDCFVETAGSTQIIKAKSKRPTMPFPPYAMTTIERNTRVRVILVTFSKTREE